MSSILNQPTVGLRVFGLFCEILLMCSHKDDKMSLFFNGIENYLYAWMGMYHHYGKIVCHNN